MATDLKAWNKRGKSLAVPHPGGLAANSVSFDEETGLAEALDDDVAASILENYPADVEDVTA
jgi:hypothetical protein